MQSRKNTNIEINKMSVISVGPSLKLMKRSQIEDISSVSSSSKSSCSSKSDSEAPEIDT